MGRIVLVTETGSDITPELAAKYGIYVVPMHVSLGDETYDDGSFPAQKIVDYYDKTGQIPKTSGCTSEDFGRVFDEIRKKWTDAEIIYLAHSSAASDSCENAKRVAEGKSYIHILDTKQLSVGQLGVITETAKYIRDNSYVSVYDVMKYVGQLSRRMKMCFVPENLEFLRAGGKFGKRAFLRARFLGIHPCIMIHNGKMIGLGNYYGKMYKVAAKIIKEYAAKYNLKKDKLWLVHSVGLPEETRNSIEDAAWSLGFVKVQWVQAKSVSTTHAGPAAFGLAGFSEE